METYRIEELFWSKVDVVPKNRCWNWRGVKDKHGYGLFHIDRKFIRASRVAFLLRHGRLPENALHKCDNPSCCNPDHIYDGTHQQNMDDMVARGRNKTNSEKIRGEQHYATNLTDDGVRQMRLEYKSGQFSLTQIAKKFGCSWSAAQRAIIGQTFKHVK